MAWAPDYATLAEAKAYVRIPDTEDDAQVALAVTAASRAIDQTANRQFGLLAAAAPRYYTAEWDRRRGRWVINIDDLMTQAGLLVHHDDTDDETYTGVIDSFRLEPGNSAADGKPWTRIVVQPDSTVAPTGRVNAVRVTAQFGWTIIPEAIKQACLMQASRLLARRDSPYGIAGSPEIGSEMRLLAKLDPDVAVTVRPYTRWWAAV